MFLNLFIFIISTMASKNQISFSLLSLILSISMRISSTLATNQIQRGFSTNPNPSSSQFQPILTDPTSTFSFGFLPIQKNQLDLAIIHLLSSFPLWRAISSQPAPWSTSTSLSFNGSLILSNHKNEIFWSTPNLIIGDNLIILNSSNLQITKKGGPNSIIWQSFDYPSDTIVLNQNFTSKSPVFSANRKFSMSLGPNYLALYFENLGPNLPMYWKRSPLQAKNEIIEGEGPIYARIDPTGYLGVYQKENAPVDVISFDTFNAGVKKKLRRLTLEHDGNFKAYYWNGSGWVSDFVAISETCELPDPCGPYGMCHVDGQVCGGCLDNRTDGCFQVYSSDFCRSNGNGFRILRRAGVDLANKELIGFKIVDSLEECEGLCERNCSCWGAIYNNVTKFCYRVPYPIQTVLAVGDERKFGYFKARNTDTKGDENERMKTVGVVLVIVGVLFLVGGCGFAAYRVWSTRTWRRSYENEMGMQYKDLNSSSFRSIEMSNSFKK